MQNPFQHPILITVASIAFVTSIFLFSGCTSGGPDHKTDPENVIIAYVFPGDRVIEMDEIDAEKLTHINYAFANIVDGRIKIERESDWQNLEVLRQIRERNPHLKLLISVGGWSWSGEFSDMALTDSSRQRFINSAIDFVLDQQLDGLDLDWEYPGLVGIGNTFRPEDKENFTLLIRESRKALNTAATEDRPLLLTIASGAFQNYLDQTEMDVVSEYLDFVNVMTYDFTGAWNDSTGHHTNLYSPELYPDASSVDRSVEMYIDAGVSPEKIVIGAAFYGRGWHEVDPADNGLFQRGRGYEGTLHYRTLMEEYLSDQNFMQLRDDAASAPFLWSPEERMFISYDDPVSVSEKARYSKEHGLRGIMFWQIFGDYDNQLLDAIYQELGAETEP